MPSAWSDNLAADHVAANNSTASRNEDYNNNNIIINNNDNYSGPHPPRSSYVPPYLRRPQGAVHSPSSDLKPPSEPAVVGVLGSTGPRPGSRRAWGGRDYLGNVGERPAVSSGGGGTWASGSSSSRSQGGSRSWAGRSSWSGSREHEANPFANDDAIDEKLFEQENTGINFDAYEDIPVETSGENVPPAVNTFAEIDLGPAVNENIRRCKYVKPTPVQRHTIPISMAGRDLMASAQTGSGKTAAFCFPIIAGILNGPPPNARPPRGSCTVFPLGLILSPTRELSMQIHEEAKKFACKTGLRVVVAYGGAPINQQVHIYLVTPPPLTYNVLVQERQIFCAFRIFRGWDCTYRAFFRCRKC